MAWLLQDVKNFQTHPKFLNEIMSTPLNRFDFWPKVVIIFPHTSDRKSYSNRGLVMVNLENRLAKGRRFPAANVFQRHPDTYLVPMLSESNSTHLGTDFKGKDIRLKGFLLFHLK